MSGGSLDYLYAKVDDAADRLDGRSPVWSAFAAHLRLVAKALHDAEWWMSCDSSEDMAIAAARRVIAPRAECDAAVNAAEVAMTQLREAIDRANARLAATTRAVSGGGQ